MSKLLILALPAAALLAACASTAAPMSANDGAFAANNFKHQVVDATPAKGAPEVDAAMSAAAIERYRTGKTKKAEADKPPPIAINISPGQ
jgi:hypothetical protein